MKQLNTVAHNRLKMESEKGEFLDIIEVVLVLEKLVYKSVNKQTVKVPKLKTVRFVVAPNGVTSLIKELEFILSELEKQALNENKEA